MNRFTHFMTSLIGSFLNTLSYIPGAALSIAVVCWCAAMPASWRSCCPCVLVPRPTAAFNSTR